MVAVADRSSDLTRAALAPASRSGRTTRAIVVVLGVLVLGGGAGFAYQLVNGLGVTGLNDGVFWGLYEVDIVTLIGFSYGGALVSAILRLTAASVRGTITR